MIFTFYFVLWLYQSQIEPFTSPDQAIFERVKSQATQIETHDWGVYVGEIAKLYIGSPYQAHTLEQAGAEQLVVNLHAFDCTTFMDTVLATAISAQSDPFNADSFRQSLKRIRYRDGQLSGYLSRLHYLSDWSYEAQRLGFVTNVTPQLGGVLRNKKINFISQHPQSYPALKGIDSLHTIKMIEDEINQREIWFLPKDRVAAIDSDLKNGDIIALTSSVTGLDVAHVGFCYRQNGFAHLLHASLKAKQVLISAQSLPQYLNENDSFDGIMVFRPRAVGKTNSAKLNVNRGKH